MKKDYQTITELSFIQIKTYLLQISSRSNHINQIYKCFLKKDLKKLFTDDKFYQQIFRDACIALYQTSNYDEMEYHLIMMNSLFQEESYCKIKDCLLDKILKKDIHVQEYCVLRHLIAFQHIPFDILVNKLDEVFHVSYLEIAKICLVEDKYHLAYQYLKRLDDCKDEAVLDLLCSYSIVKYMSLMKHYKHTRKQYYLSTE